MAIDSGDWSREDRLENLAQLMAETVRELHLDTECIEDSMFKIRVLEILDET